MFTDDATGFGITNFTTTGFIISDEENDAIKRGKKRVGPSDRQRFQPFVFRGDIVFGDPVFSNTVFSNTVRRNRPV